jgi:phosphate transport system substrate-binding protein
MKGKSSRLMSLAIPSFLLLLSACASQPLTVTHEQVTIRLVTDSACGSMVEQLAAIYEEANPWTAIEVTTFNTAIAEERLRNGTADLAALSWVTTSAAPRWSEPFATDAMVIVAHPGINAENLSLSQLQDIFRGRAGEWADGTPVQVVSREEGDGTRAVFEENVMENSDVTRTAVVMPGDDRVVAHVAATPGAIGYISLSTPTDGVRVLPIEGIRPTPDTAADYPLSYPLHLTASAEPTAETLEFIRWVQGQDGQRWVRQVFGPLPTQE